MGVRTTGDALFQLLGQVMAATPTAPAPIPCSAPRANTPKVILRPLGSGDGAPPKVRSSVGALAFLPLECTSHAEEALVGLATKRPPNGGVGDRLAQRLVPPVALPSVIIDRVLARTTARTIGPTRECRRLTSHTAPSKNPCPGASTRRRANQHG